MIISLIILITIVVSLGVFYFKLHALPERMAHKGEKVQYQIVAVLALIALFTHNHIFWIAALLLAFVRIPDFSTPLATMASALTRLADAAGAWDRAVTAPPVQPTAEERVSDSVAHTRKTKVASDA